MSRGSTESSTQNISLPVPPQLSDVCDELDNGCTTSFSIEPDDQNQRRRGVPGLTIFVLVEGDEVGEVLLLHH